MCNSHLRLTDDNVDCHCLNKNRLACFKIPYWMSLEINRLHVRCTAVYVACLWYRISMRASDMILAFLGQIH